MIDGGVGVEVSEVQGQQQVSSGFRPSMQATRRAVLPFINVFAHLQYPVPFFPGHAMGNLNLITRIHFLLEARHATPESKRLNPLRFTTAACPSAKSQKAANGLTANVALSQA